MHKIDRKTSDQTRKRKTKNGESRVRIAAKLIQFGASKAFDSYLYINIFANLSI